MCRLGILIVSNMMLYHHLMSYNSSNLVSTPPVTPLPNQNNYQAKYVQDSGYSKDSECNFRH